MNTKKNVEFKLVNIAASIKLPVIIDLYSLAQEHEEVEYEPEQFPGVIVRYDIDGTKISVLIFENGKINITGAKDTKTIDKVIDKVINLVKDHIIEGEIPPKIKYEITNKVATTNVGKKIDIARLAKEVKNVEYNPNQFPGAKMRFPKKDDPNKYISLLIFSTGKINCAGAKDNETIQKILNKAYEIIKDYFID